MKTTERLMFISIMTMESLRLPYLRNGIPWPKSSSECMKLISDQDSTKTGLAKMEDFKEKSENWSKISVENALTRIRILVEVLVKRMMTTSMLITSKAENDDLQVNSESHIILDIECGTLFVMSKNGPKTISRGAQTKNAS